LRSHGDERAERDEIRAAGAAEGTRSTGEDDQVKPKGLIRSSKDSGYMRRIKTLICAQFLAQDSPNNGHRSCLRLAHLGRQRILRIARGAMAILRSFRPMNDCQKWKVSSFILSPPFLFFSFSFLVTYKRQIHNPLMATVSRVVSIFCFPMKELDFTSLQKSNLAFGDRFLLSTCS
jgi:hypothetical protein